MPILPALRPLAALLSAAFLLTACGQNLTPVEQERVPDGSLEIADLRVGTGPAISPGDTLQIHYQESFADGRVILTSSESNNSALLYLDNGLLIIGGNTYSAQSRSLTFPALGLRMGLLSSAEAQPQLGPLRTGGIRRLRIPPQLAYGTLATGPDNVVGKTIMVEIELIRVLRGGR